MRGIKRKLKKLKGRSRRNNGFTLIESMITVVVFTFIVGGIYAIMIVGDRSWNVNNIQVEVQQELRKAMGNMQYDLMQSGSSAISDLQSDSITFQKSCGVVSGKISWCSDAIQFVRVIDPDDYPHTPPYSINDILRIEGSDTKLIARDILTLTFSQPTSGIIEISLTAQKCCIEGGKTVSGNLDFKVYLRN